MGFILPEAALDRIPPRYAPAVDDLLGRCRAVLGADLHGLYLNGSVPKGTARPGVSDLDALAIRTTGPQEDHTEAVSRIAEETHERHSVLTGVFIGLFHRDLILSRAQR